jgi:hypothetical protein
MALVTITEAAKLVRRSRGTLYRDIDRGRLSKTVAPDGATTIDTSELLRVYGTLHKADDAAEETAGISSIDDFEELVDTWEPGHPPLRRSAGMPGENARLQILEQKVKSLEHVLAVEATLRKVKDEVTTELRARLEDKDRVIKILENKVLLLDYDEPEQKYFPKKQKGLFARLFKIR